MSLFDSANWMKGVDDCAYDHYCEGYGYNCPCQWPGEVEGQGRPGPLCHEQTRFIWVVIENQELPVFGIPVSEHDGFAQTS